MSIGPRRLGKYELQQRLGRGGMAEVWKALDTQLQRYVAIKVLRTDLRTDPEFMTRFVREAQVIGSLHHPHIVQLHDFHTPDLTEGEDDDAIAYMVMDYIEGPTLAEYIRDTSRLGTFPSPVEIVHLFAALSSAVDYAHQRGLIHRDIKPANIFLDRRRPSRYQMGEPILADFGIVKLLGAGTNTMTGWLGGTPNYISPEQARGWPVTERSDIYALGVVLYEICTGVRPFQGDNPSAVIMQHLTVLPTPPHLINPRIPAALSTVILCSLAKDPAARFPSATAMSTQLAEALDVAFPLHSPAETPGKTLYRTPVLPGSSLVSADSAPSSPDISSPPSPVMPSRTRPIESNTPSSPGLSVSSPGSMIFTGTFPGATPPSQTRTFSPADQPAPDTSSPPPAPVRPSLLSGRRKALFVLSIALVLLVGAGSLLNAVYLHFHPGPTATPTANTLNSSVGRALFNSSSILDQQATQGIEDEFSILLEHIHDPAPGKHYYAWLLTDTSQQPLQALLLGTLTVKTGKVDFSYKHPQQANLLATYSRFLITEDTTPITPSPDSQSTWRYYAELPQTPSQTYTGSSALDYLRQLLGSRSGPGSTTSVGFVPPFVRNTAQVWSWSKQLKAFWKSGDALSLHQQAISILAYLDGSSYIYDEVPAETPLRVDPKRIQVPMVFLQDPAVQSNAPYSWFITNQLSGLLQAPSITPTMRQFATQAYQALGPSAKWLGALHDDTRKLVQMSNQQLLQPETMNILDHLEQQANYAYNGQTDPSTGFQGGVDWIYRNVEKLAVFDVEPVRGP